MRCPACDAELTPGVNFCGSCGLRLDSTGQVGDTRRTDQDLDRVTIRDEYDPYIGQMLNNRFLVESKLGEGGFGSVYRGTQKGTGRKVALKLLHPDMTQDENLVARFRREGLLMCNLNDAHTVTTYDFDQTSDGTLFIAMELLEGRSLHEVYHAEAPIEWQRMLKIIVQMSSSLAEAHAQGIVHRDLKPENIYLESRPTEPEFVKILDFGIAKVMQGEGGNRTPQLTATGQTLGTLEYMSPEQLMGKQLDGRSDIYTVGVLAYEMITGRLPFPDAKGPAALITAQLRQVPELPSKANPGAGIPPEVDSIVLKMLEKDKNNRFANVEDLSRACTDALRAAQAGPMAQAGAPMPGTEPPGAMPPMMAPMGPGMPPAMGAPMPPPGAAQLYPQSHPQFGGAPPGAPMAPGQMLPPGAPMPQMMPQMMPQAQLPHAPQIAVPRLMQPAPPTMLVGSRVGSSRVMWLWFVLALIVLGAAVGAAMALL